MSRLPRIFVIAVVALWLPLCCCQVLAFADASCETSRETARGHASCCHDDASDNESNGEDQDERAPRSCEHCVIKAPAPQPPSLDAYFILAEIPFEAILPPSVIDPLQLYAAEHAGGWPLAPTLKPPAPPLLSSERCALLTLWTL